MRHLLFIACFACTNTFAQKTSIGRPDGQVLQTAAIEQGWLKN